MEKVSRDNLLIQILEKMKNIKEEFSKNINENE